MLELAQSLARLADSRSKVVFVPRPEDDPSIRQPDIFLAKHRLDWEPHVSLETGLTRTIGWFRDHPEIVRGTA